MARALYTVLALLLVLALALPAAARAQDSGIPTLPDPIFVNLAAPSSFAGNNEIGFSFQSDNDRCHAKYGDNWYYSCQRDLGLAGKKVTAGITVDPPVKGEWRWQSDYYLTFTPEDVWQSGTVYKVAFNLDEMKVPPSVVFNGTQRRMQRDITSDPLTLKFTRMDYMQDPDDAARKLVSAQISANYPFTFDSLKSRIKLEIEEGNSEKLKTKSLRGDFELTAINNNQGINLAIPVKSLPDDSYFIRATIESGVTALKGGKPTAAPVTERARIPTLNSYLTLQNPTLHIARLDNGTPQQTLSFGTNVKAKPDTVLKNAKLYLLPAQHPVMQRDKTGNKSDELYAWTAANEVTPEILAQAETISLTAMDGADGYETQFSFPVIAPAERYAFLSVAADMDAFGGYTLGRPFEAIIRIPAWPHDIRIMQDGSILTLSGARKLSLHARGTDRLALDVAHIRSAALSHFVSQTGGDIRQSEFRSWNFGAEDVAELDSKDVPMNLKSPEESQYAAFDFSPYLKDGRKGLFLLNIQGYREDKLVGGIEQRFVLVTDMGLLIKQNRDETRDAYLMSFTTGQPVEGAKLSVLGRNGLPVFTGTSDTAGHVSIPVMADNLRDREPVAIIAEKGDDLTFIPYNRHDRVLNISEFDVGGASIPAEGINAFLFTDRGIYRPGETAQIGMVIRNADWTSLPPDMPLQLIINDARGRTVRDEIIKFPAAGIMETALATSETSTSGTYRAYLHIPGNDYPGTMLGSVAFKVQDFQPDRLKIKTTLHPAETKGWLSADKLEAHVTLTNLYGTPASARRIAAAITLNPADLSFTGYDDYRFYDSYPATPRTVEYDLADTTTDSKGEAILKLNIDQQEKQTYSLNLQTRGFEAGSGRGVTSYTTAMVSPMPYVVGYKTDARLDYLKKGQSYEIELIALSPDLAHLPLKNLKRALMKRTYVSSLVRQSNGAYKYESVPREETIETDDFTIASGGTAMPLPTDETGQYSYVLRDDNDVIVASIPFAVAGEGGDGTGKDREAVLDIRINKQSYETGEDIEIAITAPYTGAGLITLESDHVIAHQWFKADGTDTIQKIAIPATFSGKGYVSVAFVRDINSREIYLSPLSHAIVPFKANTSSRTVKIDLTVPPTVKPGEDVIVTYKGSTKGKAVIYAVDEGILQVARYQTPDPVDFFLLNRALQVRTSQMLDLLMPEFDLVRTLSADGGDADAVGAALGKHMNPFKRKTLAPAIYWSGIVDIDTTEKTVTFTPPGHFNGEMRVMAVAVADGAVGGTEGKTTVRGDIVVTPNLPLFMAPGDTATVSVTIANNTGTDGKLTLAVAASTGLTVDDAPQYISIDDGTEDTISFTVKATDILGSASLTVSASQGELSQSAEATLSIRPASPRETTLTAGYAEKGKAEVKLTRVMYPEMAERSLALAPLPTTYIFGLMRYLNEFPYGCTEQLVSKTLPQLALAGRPEFAAAAPDIDSAIASTIAQLRLRQTPEGGFSLWDGGQVPDEFATLYALDFLVTAMESGKPVPSRMVEDGLRYLRDRINQNISTDKEARERSYGVYILTRSGIVTSNEILHVLRYYENSQNKNWQQDLPGAYIAASYKLMQQSSLADKTIDQVIRGLKARNMTFENMTWDDNPFVTTARAITIIARHFPDHATKLDNDTILKLAAFIQEQRYNTLAAAYAIEALTGYASAAGKDMAAEAFTVKADGKALPMNEKISTTVPLSTRELDIHAKSRRPLFYVVAESGFDRAPQRQESAEKLEISRVYNNADGKPVDGPVQTGDVVTAEITVRAHGDRFIENVAIVDLLPGGFELEPADEQLSSTMAAAFTERREDRIITFGTVGTEPTTIKYRLRAVSRGTYTAPPPFAEAMYDITAKASGIAGTLTIEDAP